MQLTSGRRRARLLTLALAALTLATAAPALAVGAPTAPAPVAVGASAGVGALAVPGRAAGAAATEPGHPTIPSPTNPQNCDPVDPALCLLPFPNDWHTRADATSATGRRVDLTPGTTPRSTTGVPINTLDYNQADGWSVGAPIVTRVPGLEGATGTPGYRTSPALVNSGIATLNNMSTSRTTNDGVVLLDAATGERQLVWAELDRSADAVDATRMLLIRHGAVLKHGRRYIVALQHLKTAAGVAIPAQAPFAAYKAGTGADARRQTHLNTIFGELASAGVAKADLYLAWDFTTASSLDTAGRLLAMRDDAFAGLGDTTMADLAVQGTSPPLTVTTVTDFTPAQNSRIARRIVGQVDVPCYVAPDCTQAGAFPVNPATPDARPVRTGGTAPANFQCEVPRRAFGGGVVGAAGGQQLRPSLYGHGLFGGEGEAGAGNVSAMAQEHGMLECGVRWFGMATTDVPNAIAALTNLSLFPTLIDRVQQGELGFLFVGRSMIHPQGMCADAAFQRADGSCVIDRQKLFYDGNSQGGIYGGTVVAISPDLQRGVLGVPGMGYATLLPRSSDYVARCAVNAPNTADPQCSVGYSAAIDVSYDDPSVGGIAGQRMLIFSLIQNLWDRGDPSGYAEHMTSSPLPNTPPHEVLLQVGYGDHQVANVTAEAEARAVGARLVAPGLPAGRASYDNFNDIPTVPSFPADGSGLSYFDIGPTRDGGNQGTDEPPTESIPPRAGRDPHEAPRADGCGRQQKSDFLKVDGKITMPCAAPFLGFRMPDTFVPTDGSVTGPTPVVPEAPWAVLLLLVPLAVGGVVIARRRPTERTGSLA